METLYNYKYVAAALDVIVVKLPAIATSAEVWLTRKAVMKCDQPSWNNGISGYLRDFMFPKSEASRAVCAGPWSFY